MKRLRPDTHGDESLMPVLIFVTAFITASIVILGTISAGLADFGGAINNPTGSRVIGDAQYSIFDPTDGYNISTNQTQTIWDHDNDLNVHFDGSAYDEYSDDYTVAVIRDNEEYQDLGLEFQSLDWNWVPGIGFFPQVDIGVDQETLYSDFLLVFVDFPTDWLTWESYDEIAIPLTFITSAQLERTNMSVVTFDLDGLPMSLFVGTFGTPEEHSLNIWLNNYVLSMGVDTRNATTTGETSMWEIISRLLTAQLPDTDPFISYMIAIPIWAAIGFFVLTLLSRFIPLISGG